MNERSTNESARGDAATIDPIELVRRHRPALVERDSGWATSDRGQQILRRAMDLGALEASALRPPRRAPRRAVLAVLTGAAVVAVSAFTYVTFTQADDPVQAGCYQRLDPDANTVEAPPDVVERQGAAEACLQVWRRGIDTPEGSYRPVSCVNTAGGRGVFPAPVPLTAEVACAQIGWQPEG